MTPSTIAASPGDTISFTWTGEHNVYRMKGADSISSYPCDFAGASFLGSASPVEYVVGDEAAMYFSCEISDHCGAGQKLTIVGGNATVSATTNTTALLSAAELGLRATHLVGKLVILVCCLVFVLMVVVRVLRVHRRASSIT